MKWLNGHRMRIVLVRFVAVIVLGGGSAKADFTFGGPINLGPMVSFPAFYDQAPNISADGSTLFFCSNRASKLGGGDIYQPSIEPVVDFNADRIVDAADMCIYCSTSIRISFD